MTRIRFYGPTVVLLITVLTVMIAGPGMVRRIAWAQQAERIELIRDRLSSSPTLQELSNSFREVATIVEPSVVHLQVYSKQLSRAMRAPMDEDTLRRFFGPHAIPPAPEEDEPDPPPAPTPRRDRRGENMDRYNVPQQYGNGSGWVYDDQGHVITNNHVVTLEDRKTLADKIVVRFKDGSERTATVVGTDPKTDVAVLKVAGGALHPARLAAEPVQQGDIVFAFGSPFRFDFSMSQGIVSAKGRHLGILRDTQGYENFIQTDAAINPGNSGGPLTNIRGEVVGMNSAIATRTGAYNGLGFAIPVDMVHKVADQIIKTGKVSRGYLGIFIRDLDPKLASTFGFDGKGVVVETPIEGGPAEGAGLKRGDIITEIEDQPVTTADELRTLVAGYPAGKKLTIQLYRQEKPKENAKAMKVTVTVAELPDQVARAAPSSPPPPPATAQEKEMQSLRRLGLEGLATCTEELARRYGIKFTPGVLVTGVRADSAAAAADVMRGSVITDVMGVPVKTIEELAKEIAKHDLKKGVRLSVSDNGVSRFVLLEMSE